MTLSLTTPEKIRDLQKKLYLKAKQEPKYRFYTLYDKVYRLDILAYAYRQSRASQGKPGVDGQTFADIESYGVERFLEELSRELKDERYRPEAVRRVVIPKADGGERPLGIPTIRDRVVQTAVKIILEPIFEADFTDNAYGYRPKRDAKQAVKEVHKTLKAGYVEVVDADLSRFFDTIPHTELMKSVARRISDGAILHLLKMWLDAPIEETDSTGRQTRRNSGKKGTPQGGVISPLLANIYMRRFLKAWEMRGNDTKYQARIINYADDFVILCKQNSEEASREARDILACIGLELNQAKTKTCNIWQESFEFLGYRFGQQYYFGSGSGYIGVSPSKKSEQRIKMKLRRMTRNHMAAQSHEIVIRRVNRVLMGWMNYYSYGNVRKSYDRIERFLRWRFRYWLAYKHGIAGISSKRFSVEYLHEDLGLLHLNA